jgi:hypothetical protein
LESHHLIGSGVGSEILHETVWRGLQRRDTGWVRGGILWTHVDFGSEIRNVGIIASCRDVVLCRPCKANRLSRRISGHRRSSSVSGRIVSTVETRLAKSRCTIASVVKSTIESELGVRILAFRTPSSGPSSTFVGIVDFVIGSTR